mgnify:CR=1 FL=1
MSDSSITLNGQDLEFDDFSRIVDDRVEVQISQSAEERINQAREYVMDNIDTDKAVYGLNRGVGENKDQVVLAEYFENYNKNLIYAHCVAVKPEAKEWEVRAALAARLNTLLVGRTGIQPDIVKMYRDFLNHEIHPVLPKRGSIGQGDIACLSHIGLAMIGEGEVFYQGKRMNAEKALDMAGLTPIKLGPKDGLAIVSSNALSAGIGAMMIKEVDQLIKTADLVYSFSLEGIKGNVTPLDLRPYKYRPYDGQKECVERVRDYLDGSYLWQPGITDTLQDALSYRSACHVHGAAVDSLNYAKEQLKTQLNSSDDNPCVLFEDDDMISCGNYEPLTWVLALEMLSIGLSHVSKTSCSRTRHLSDPDVTGLSRFLTPKMGETIAYGTIQKPFTALNSEVRELSNPSSVDYMAVAGNIEDHASNAPQVVDKLSKIIDNIYYILGLEALHAAQAVDLRGVEDSLGEDTKKLYKSLREDIPFLDQDRPLTDDIEKSYQVVKNNEIID